MQQIVVMVVVAVAYVGLSYVSKAVAFAQTDAWTVWLSSGVVLGTLLATTRDRWWGALAGGFIGATVFALVLDVSFWNSLGYGVIEVVAAGSAAFLVSYVSPLPIRLERPRELAATVFAGALPLALVGAILATAWHVATAGTTPALTFKVWLFSNFLGTLLVAPVIIAWAGFRVRRSGGLPATSFAAGAIACALFLAIMHLVFDVGIGLGYAPVMLIAIVALYWGTRGATLVAFLGALIAIINTAQHEGPFAVGPGLLGDPELDVQAYSLVIAVTGLLIAVLDAAKRNAIVEARAWRTRFDAAIGAHRLLAYEWDPASNRIVVTGDAKGLLGVAPERIATLADWIGLVDAQDRERVETRFDERVRGQGDTDAITYLARTGDGTLLEASDEARAIRDHDGQLHRVVGIVRIAPVARTAPLEAAA